MKFVTIVAVAVLLGAAGAAYAADRGASGYSPGDQMHDSGTTGKGGASRYAPGQRQTSPGGASALSPGDQMNDKRGR